MTNGGTHKDEKKTAGENKQGPEEEKKEGAK